MVKLKEKEKNSDVNALGSETVIIKLKNKVFNGINFVLAPLFIGVLLTGLCIEYYKNGKFFSVEKMAIAFGVLSSIILIFNLVFSRYKLSFNEKEITYQNFLTKRTINISQIEYARYEYGHKNISAKYNPINRFVVYPKSNLKQSPLIINLIPLANIEKLVFKLDELGKLNFEKDYTE